MVFKWIQDCKKIFIPTRVYVCVCVGSLWLESSGTVFFVLTHACVFIFWKITALRWRVSSGSLHRLKSIRFWPWVLHINHENLLKPSFPESERISLGDVLRYLTNLLLSKTIFIMKIWHTHINTITYTYTCYLSSAAACRMLTTPHLQHIFSIVWRYLEWVTPKTSRRHKERWNCFRAHVL